jgi:hypothetical protein
MVCALELDPAEGHNPIRIRRGVRRLRGLLKGIAPVIGASAGTRGALRRELETGLAGWVGFFRVKAAAALKCLLSGKPPQREARKAFEIYCLPVVCCRRKVQTREIGPSISRWPGVNEQSIRR